MSCLFTVGESRELIGEELFVGLKTPLGNIELSAEIGNINLTFTTYMAAFKTDCGYLFRWVDKMFVAELMLREEAARIPEGMHVDACWSARWRIHANMSIQGLFFYCKWKPGYSWTEGGPDSGEGFDAQTYQNDKYMITISTEDAYKLELRAKHYDWMPDRLVDRFVKETDKDIIDCHMESSQKELKVIIPDFLNGEKCQVNFSIAWAEYQSSDDVSIWYAVDMF